MPSNQTQALLLAAHQADTTGALEIGSQLSSILLGVTIVQTFYYYRTFPEDAWKLKVTVSARH